MNIHLILLIVIVCCFTFTLSVGMIGIVYDIPIDFHHPIPILFLTGTILTIISIILLCISNFNRNTEEDNTSLV